MPESTSTQSFPSNVIIVGAGVFGLSTALAIAKRHPSTAVTVIDRLTPPVEDGTSVDTTRYELTNCVDYTDPIYRRLAIKSQNIIRDDPDLEPFYHQQGMTFVCDGEPGRFTDSWNARFGAADREHIVERTSREEVFQAIHGEDSKPRPLSELGDKSYWNKGYCNIEAAFIDARESVQAYYNKCLKYASISFRCGVPVERLQVQGNVVSGVTLADGTSLSADKVIIAAGAWSSKLVDLGARMYAIGHEVVWFKVTPEEDARWKNMSITTNESTGLNVFPPYNGEIKVLRRSPGFKNTVTVTYPENPSREVEISYPRTIVDNPTDTIPLEAEQAIRPDFIIAPHPKLSGVHLATGGSAHAWKFVPILGDCVVDSINGTMEQELVDKWAFHKFTGGKDDAAPRMDGDPEELREVIRSGI
ncbi:FAD dependent oxidoreductase [Fusarium albosuccineum]|uniref:FAD dependent oxidoreductase n=1 Tax=Fusarium albosuccineum TaxID=1237068 RepID=A0A8H4PGA5_9HYPO|nr:FAD dependent oxidoreductase [Fusarium albosuccineum]